MLDYYYLAALFLISSSSLTAVGTSGKFLSDLSREINLSLGRLLVALRRRRVPGLMSVVLDDLLRSLLRRTRSTDTFLRAGRSF